MRSDVDKHTFFESKLDVVRVRLTELGKRCNMCRTWRRGSAGILSTRRREFAHRKFAWEKSTGTVRGIAVLAPFPGQMPSELPSPPTLLCSSE